MSEREKIINELTEIYDEAYSRWVHSLYIEDELVILIRNAIPHALSFLYVKEPVIPHVERDSDDGSWYYGCGACHGAIDYKDKFCRHCGREVMWEEDDGKDSTKTGDIQ